MSATDKLQKHTDYENNAGIWKRCRDVLAGQDAIHAGKETYLPRLDGMEDIPFAAYIARTRFFNASDRTKSGMLGLVSRKPVYTLPEEENFAKNVDHKDSTLEEYAFNVLTEVLSVGRAGTLLDYPTVKEGMTIAQAEAGNLTPIWALYTAENIYNWKFKFVNNSYQLTYLMLYDGKSDEDGEELYYYRELELLDGVYVQRILVAKDADTQPVQKGEDQLPKKGGKTFDFIPFFFHNIGGRVDCIAKPPLLDLFDTNIKHYQLKADHIHALHYVALPTPWATGVSKEDAPSTIGPQRIWTLPNETARVGMLEFTGAGIESIAKELETIESHMAQLGSRMLAPESSYNETAKAATIKSMAENSTLSGLVKSVNKDLTQTWQLTLLWMGKPDEEATVQMNTDFMPTKLEAQELIALVSGWQTGAFSKETLFYNLQQGEIIPDDTTFDDEEAKIDLDNIPGAGITAPTDTGADE